MKKEKPILMFNALWFKPEGGWEQYKMYMEKVRPLLEKHGGRVKDGGIPTKSVIGEFDADLIFLVEYPSWRAFIQFTQDPEYTGIRPYREEAIVNSLLIRCDKLF